MLDWPVWPFVVIAALGALGYAVAPLMRFILRVMGEPVDEVDPTQGAEGGIEV